MKVVAMLLMLVGLCSCVNRGPVATITTETGIPMRVTEFTYKGHSYIWFSKSSGQSGIVHNPDCRCNPLSHGSMVELVDTSGLSPDAQ